MSHWKAGPERPRLPFCWECSRRFWGRAFARIEIDGIERDVHKGCVPEGVRPLALSTTSSAIAKTSAG